MTTEEEKLEIIKTQQAAIRQLQTEVKFMHDVYNSLDKFAKATSEENSAALTYLRAQVQKVKQSVQNDFTEMLLLEYNVIIKKLGGLDSE